MLGQFRMLARLDPSVLTTLGNLRYILYGGAPMDRDDVEWFRTFGVRLQHSMGMTEVGDSACRPRRPRRAPLTN